MFLTVATEMTLKIWRLGDTKPMFVYELHNQVGEQDIIIYSDFPSAMDISRSIGSKRSGISFGGSPAIFV